MRDLADCRAGRALAAFLALSCALAGCQSLRHGSCLCLFRRSASESNPLLDEATRCGEKAAKLEKAGKQEAAVDWHFAAARLHWQAAGCTAEDTQPAASTWEPYNRSLAALIRTAASTGRLNPASGLTVREDNQTVTIPVVHQGFAWNDCDFQRLFAPPVGHEPLIRRHYGCAGIGTPLVAQRCRNPHDPLEARFYPEKSPFAATALLRFDGPTANSASLEFHNPLNCQKLSIAQCAAPLASNLTAPLATSLEETPRTYFAGFIQPGQGAATAKLELLEPYQPGKVPVVLIHGLFSDPSSWADMINDLRASPGFSQRYQIWVFRYPTGQGFLQSAAKLRGELGALIEALDPECSDPALRRMVLVGHSMGGLIAKLQITYAEDRIWCRLANRPLEEIVATDLARKFLTESCFFDPSPYVARVIFIATPHRGSLYSSAAVGELASKLVKPAPEQRAMHDQLIDDNPDTFNPLIERRFPTSIDLLTPGSPLLEVMQQMRINPSVCLHTIAGVYRPLSLDGPSDGVVSANSAAHPCCETVLAIAAPHAEVHRTPQASCEVCRILDRHWQATPGQRPDP